MDKNKSNKTKVQQENNRIANKTDKDMSKEAEEKLLKEQQEYKEKKLIVSALGQANRDDTKSTLRSVKTLINVFKDEELDTVSDDELSRIAHVLDIVYDKIQSMKTDCELRSKNMKKLKEEIGIENPIFMSIGLGKTFPFYGLSKYSELLNSVPTSVYKPYKNYV